VLYGMGFRTAVDAGDNAQTRMLAAQQMQENAAMTQKMRKQLPKNRDLVRKIQEYGLQPI
jgi:tryptophan halogenase